MCETHQKQFKWLSYFAVEILYEGIFGHVTTFWIFIHVKIVLIVLVTAASIPIIHKHLFASS